MKYSFLRKPYITAIAFVLILLALVFFFINPLLKEVKKNFNNLVSIKNQILSLQLQNKEIENFKGEYQGYKNNLETIDSLFINNRNPVDFIKFLEATSQKVGVSTKISLVPYSNEKNVTSITFQISSKEDFLKITNLIKELESGPYLVEVQSVDLRASDETKESPSGTTDVNITIKAFNKT